MPETFEQFARDLLPALREVPSTIHASLERSASIQQRIARSKAPRRTGELRRSIVAQVSGRDGSMKATTSMPGKYAPVEFGGNIRPRRGRFLAVPIQPATELLPGPRSDVAGLFFLRMRDGRRFLASRRGGAIDMRWRLVESVRVRGRGFMQAGLQAGADDFEGRSLDDLEKVVT